MNREGFVYLDELLSVGVTTSNTSIRYACLKTVADYALKNEDGLRWDWMPELFKKGSAKEKDALALMMFATRDTEAINIIAPYYVAKLDDDDYGMTGFDGRTPFWRSWHKGIEVVGTGTNYFMMVTPRGAWPGVDLLGRASLPWLVKSLLSEDILTRANAYMLLREIAEIETPFYEDSARLYRDSMTELLRKRILKEDNKGNIVLQDPVKELAPTHLGTWLHADIYPTRPLGTHK